MSDTFVLAAFVLAADDHPLRLRRVAVILTFVIAEAGILLGSLDAVAPIITMFFVITYGALNLATFTEALSGNPSYRPTFRWCHWSVALFGALGRPCRARRAFRPSAMCSSPTTSARRCAAERRGRSGGPRLRAAR